MRVQHIQKFLFIRKNLSFFTYSYKIRELFSWPSDKSDGLGSTSRVSQETSCSVPGGAITSIEEPTENNMKQYFESAMSTCIEKIAINRKSRAIIFLGK